MFPLSTRTGLESGRLCFVKTNYEILTSSNKTSKQERPSKVGRFFL